MNTRKQHHSTTCRCGCAPCDDRCCELECHSRPRFFCGQLLTDEDLSAMVGWAASKFRLQRYRTGWGVACGLAVTCDPTNPLGVIVAEGYAVSCCGDDIIVCADTPLDLSGACQDENPCADPREAIRAAERGSNRGRERRIAKAASGRVGGTSPVDAVVESMEEGLDEAGDSDGDREEPQVRWVDVFVRYAEQDDELRATHGHSECAAGPDCEPAKVKETSELHWERGAPRPDTVLTDAWCDGYKKCLDVLRRYQQQVGSSYDTGTVRAWLLRWVEQHPPTMFCDLRDLICDLPDNELAGRQMEILAKLATDCRVAYSRRDCHSCERGQGVRLARVYLGPATAGGECRVLCIDSFPPYRRPLSRSEVPAPVGSVNVASLIGASWDEARVRLADLGVRASRVVLGNLEDVDDLLNRLDCECGPVVKAGDEVNVLLMELDGPMHGRRVVGFCRKPEGGEHVGEYHAAAARNAEIELWKEATSAGQTVAERLVDRRLTVRAVAAMPRSDAIAAVQGALPRNQHQRADKIVGEAREWPASTG